jgi:hypothetical protein
MMENLGWFILCAVLVVALALLFDKVLLPPKDKK